ncbi:MAG: hypothetical protein R3E44_11975 [Paracoccaceae bacterium]
MQAERPQVNEWVLTLAQTFGRTQVKVVNRSGGKITVSIEKELWTDAADGELKDGEQDVWGRKAGSYDVTVNGPAGVYIGKLNKKGENSAVVIGKTKLAGYNCKLDGIQASID